MTSIKKVAVAGASGNLGPSIIDALLAAGFTVTALSRSTSTATFPTGVHVSRVDFTSVSSLTPALSGQDAVVCTFGSHAVGEQFPLIEAAIAAGVKRFIPSEFGSDTMHPRARSLPVFNGKMSVQAALVKEAERTGGEGMSYTFVENGPFLDWCLKFGFPVDPKKKVATLWDGGERPYSTTTLATIGKAVAGVLRKPEETKNRAIYVQDTVLTIKELENYLHVATGGSEGWSEKVVKTEDALAESFEEAKKEKPDMMRFFGNQVATIVWGEGYGAVFQKLDNELLGIPQKSEKEVQEILNKAVQEL